MAEVLSFLFVFGVLGLGIAAVVMTLMKGLSQREGVWREVADNFGLELRPGSLIKAPSIAGLTDGFSVEVSTADKGNGTETRYRIGYPRSSVQGMTLRREKPFMFKIAKPLLGINDIEIGDNEFDMAVVIDATDSAAMADYLTPARREALLALFDNPGLRDTIVTADSIEFGRLGIAGERSEMVSTISDLLVLARIMVDPIDAPPTLPAFESKPMDQIVVPTPPEPIPSVPEPRMPEPVTVESESAAPEDSLASGATDLALDEQSVMTDLFDSARVGFDVDTHFDENYQGVQVEWSGEVDTVRTFRGDRDFAGAGTKVTVVLGYLGETKLSSRQVKAVVQLPEGADVERGESISFVAELIRADRFTKTLYVANGILA